MRKTIEVRIDTDNRDKGKVFHITEMPASQAEKWAVRAFLALSRAGVDIPDDVSASGIVGLASIGFKMLGSMSFGDAEPLMDEMMRCVKIAPNPERLDLLRPLVEDDIQEVSTRFRLRTEIFSLHTGFSLADAQSMSVSANPPSTIQNTVTSPAPLVP